MSFDLDRLASLCGSPWGLIQNPRLRTRNSEGLPVTVVVTRNHDNSSLGSAYSFEGVGTSFDPNVAFAKSILEAAERYCQTFAPKPKALIEGSYIDLKKSHDLIGPESLNLYSNTVYENFASQVCPYQKDKSFFWTPVTSVKTGRQCWIPADFVYYNTQATNRLYIQTSNGTAIHESLERAIDSATLELIERDLLMIYWKNNIKPLSIQASSVFSLLGIESQMSCLDFFENIRFYWYPLPFSLYAISCAIFGNTDKGQPAFVLGGSTHQDPSKAFMKATEEALQIYSLSQVLIKGGRKLKPDEVINFSDHAYFYANSENNVKHNLIFQKDSKEQINISDMLKTVNSCSPSKNSIQDYLESINQELFYRDLTTRDIEHAGYKVVRAISPGLLGLDMNHNLRLDQISANRKYWIYKDGAFQLQNFTQKSLNESPHPFA